MAKYARDFDGYKIKFSGVAYISSDYADSIEEARDLFLDDESIAYMEKNIDSSESVDEMIMNL